MMFRWWILVCLILLVTMRTWADGDEEQLSPVEAHPIRFTKPTNVQTILLTDDGTVWADFWSKKGGIAYYADAQWRYITPPAPDVRCITDMTIDQQKTLYAATYMGPGIWKIDLATKTSSLIRWPVKAPQWDEYYDRTCGIVSNDHALFVGTMTSIMIWKKNQWFFYCNTLLCRPLLADATGVWCTDEKFQLRHLNEKAEVDISYKLPDAENENWVTFIGGEGNALLIGREFGELYRFDPTTKSMTLLSRPPKGIRAPVMGVARYLDDLYIAYGTSSYKTGGIGRFNLKNGSIELVESLENYKTVLVRDRSLWVAGPDGVARLPLVLLEYLLNEGEGH